MRTGTICQYSWWMEMGALFSILGAVLFSTTSDDISTISHVFAHLWQITPSDAASTCPSDKGGGGWCLADGWVTTAELGEEKPNPEAAVRTGKRCRGKSQGLLWTWNPRGEAVSLNLGLIHVRVCLLSPWEGSRRLIKFKWKWSWLHEWADIRPAKRPGQRGRFPFCD